MDTSLVNVEYRGSLVSIILNDPARRNALGLAMFEALEVAIHSVEQDEERRVVLLRGEGKAFCAGFDLGAAVENPDLMGEYIHRLSQMNRRLRRLSQVVVVEVQGAAIAGGCAMLSAGDFVVMANQAKAGYPVHALGVSPAVTIPTLQQAIGPGAARDLLLGGRLIDGVEAKRLGLATHLATSNDTVHEEAMALCDELLAKPEASLRITKAWLNELDGSMDDSRFDAPAQGSIELTHGDEARELLRSFWASR
ncbi:MAG: enoyl-CoA hydratase/isomerase family protein [Planctomycetota bacterium]|nr:enoyl-CoA hydratase/isomerase family protein [Planctomycetota bacterium]